MSPHRRSYAKTVGAAGAAGLFCLAGCAAALAHALHATASGLAVPLLTTALGLLLGACTLFLALACWGGCIALRRDALEREGRPYASRGSIESPGGPMVRLRRGFRHLLGPTRAVPLMAGDEVDIRPLVEIMTTLDELGMRDGLPFMPEMAKLCGTRATVLRRVDKLNDWVGQTGLRRVRNTVLLRDVRCTGENHGGCEAQCHVRWHESWLRLAGSTTEAARERTTVESRNGPSPDVAMLSVRPRDDRCDRFTCQATELCRGTTMLRRWDPMHRLRDLSSGNVRTAAFVRGICLAAFNHVQHIRGGVPAPYLLPRASRPTPHRVLDLLPGEWVRVRTKREIEDTLDASFCNRGLRFDPEMVRHCGGVYRVKTRLSRVIRERTGELVQLRTPCVLLEGVTATGEYVSWNPENESVYWREIWLERVDAAANRAVDDDAPATVSRPAPQDRRPFSRGRLTP